MRALALIPARAGSKGIPGKNVKDFAGRPLLAWTIDAARSSGCFERIVLSTDDEGIRALGERLGAEAPFLRPAELATDDSPTAPAVRHALERLAADDGWHPEVVAVLEPTSPARLPDHVRGAMDLLVTAKADTVATVSEIPHHFVPEKALALAPDLSIRGADGTPVNRMVHRRQDLATYYAFNGLVFGCRADLLRSEPPTLWGVRVLGYVVDRRYSLDLDDPEDWSVAEAMMRRLMREAGGG